MEIQTERLILRDLVLDDALELSNQGNDLDINLFAWYIPFPFSFDEAQKLIGDRIKDYQSKRTIYEFAIILKSTGNLIGLTSFYDLSNENKKAKVGYWLGKSFRGKGFGKEVLKSMIDFGFNQLDLNKITATVLEENEKSNNLLKKFNFRLIGVKKQDQFIQGKFRNVLLWELLR